MIYKSLLLTFGKYKDKNEQGARQEDTDRLDTNSNVIIIECKHYMDKYYLKKYMETGNCPVRNVLDRIGDKWSMLVMLVLGDTDILRFSELHKYIGSISQKMLTVTLKTLETDGLIQRTVYPEVPPRVEYQLTPMGRSLLPLLRNLTEWARENMQEIEHARMRSIK